MRSGYKHPREEMGVVMPVLVRRHPALAHVHDLPEWLETPWPSLLPFGPGQAFRVEDYTEDGTYVVRAELPGLDPERDVEVSASSGVLTVHAERREETKEDRHSEFRYGSLSRSISLPDGADPDNITAKYGNGILEVRVPVPGPKATSRHIAVGQST